MSGIRFEVVNKLEDRFLTQWRSVWLNYEGAHFFNSPMWFLACLDAFSIKEFYIFCQYEDDNLVIVLPLIKSYKYGFNVFCSPGSKYLDKTTLLFIGYDYVKLNFFLNKILKYGNLYLAEIDVNLKNSLNNLYLCFKSSDNPYIKLDNPFGGLNKKHKSEIKNKIKKLENDLSFELCVDETEKYLQDIFAIEDKSYKRQKGRNIFYDSRARKLYENIAKAENNNSAIALLYFKKRPIAHLFGLTYKNIFLAYHMAYLVDYRKIMPGKILIYYLIKALSEQDYILFDFSRGRSSLKSQFTKIEVEQYSLLASNNIIIRFFWQWVVAINLVIGEFRNKMGSLRSKIKYVKI